MLLLLSAVWPQRALLRAQLEEETGQEVIATDSATEAADWLYSRRFRLVIVDTQGLSPDARLTEALRVHRPPVVLVAGVYHRHEWETDLADLDVKSVLVRPVLIGDVTRAAVRAVQAG